MQGQVEHIGHKVVDTLDGVPAYYRTHSHIYTHYGQFGDAIQQKHSKSRKEIGESIVTPKCVGQRWESAPEV